MVHLKSLKGKHILIFASVFLFCININTLFLHGDGDYHVYSNPVYRISEFLFGIAFCKLRNEGILNKLPNYIKSPILISIILFITTTTSLSKPSYNYLGLQFINAFLFGVLMYNFEISKLSILQNKILVRLGDISYSFFLFQGIAINLTKKYFLFNSILLSIIAFCINIIFAYFVYYFYEEPIRKYIIKMFNNNNTI
jgi:peptidoglycan/LPS O-acetylase OafA/YrhL